ncbi:Uncharacterised protein [Leminorella grimontii]|nr:hypothetical protein SOASR031_19610 [Leminorella grimontii]VFS55049.1 Uncharacterised protein [Leminorella grimontii]
MQAEALARKALDPIAFMGSLYVFFGDGQTKTWMSQRVESAKDGYLGGTRALRLLKNKREITGS